jgi:hypothetical protein
MSAWEKLAENRIQEAIESGQLELPASAGPLDLTGYFALPPAERAGVMLLRNAGVLPPEVELLKQEAALESELTTATGDRARELKAQLEQIRVTFRMNLERRAQAARKG